MTRLAWSILRKQYDYTIVIGNQTACHYNHLWHALASCTILSSDLKFLDHHWANLVASENVSWLSRICSAQNLIFVAIATIETCWLDSHQRQVWRVLGEALKSHLYPSTNLDLYTRLLLHYRYRLFMASPFLFIWISPIITPFTSNPPTYTLEIISYLWPLYYLFNSTHSKVIKYNF